MALLDPSKFIGNHSDMTSKSRLQTQALSRMIFRVADLDIFLKMSPKFGITPGWTQDPNLGDRIGEELTIMFEKPGELLLNLAGCESN